MRARPLALLGVVLVAACDSSTTLSPRDITGLVTADPTSSVASVTLDQNRADQNVGQNFRLVATSRDAGGSIVNGTTPRWTSSDSLAVGVTQEGVVQPRMSGKAWIRAMINGRGDSALIRVYNPTGWVPPVPVTKPVWSATAIRLDQHAADQNVGQIFSLVASPIAPDGSVATNVVVEWTSTNSASVVVDQAGKVTPVAVGEAWVKASIGIATDSARIRVYPAPAPAPTTSVASVTLDQHGADQNVGQNFTLVATVKNASGAVMTETVAWSSSNSAAVTVDQNGGVRPIAVGQAWVKAAAAGAADSALIRVYWPAGWVPPTTSTTPTAPSPSAPAPTPTAPAAPTTTTGPLMLGDDFTGYSSIGDVLAKIGSGKLYTEVMNANLLSLDGSVTYNGHRTLRFNQPGGLRDTPELFMALPYATSKIWMRAKVRFSPGWNDIGQLSASQSANAYKLMGWGWAGGYEDRGTLDFSNTNEYQVSNGVKPNGGGSGSGTFDIVRAGRTTTEWTDGEWYDMIISYEVTGPKSMRTRFWLARDGQTPVLRATLEQTIPSNLSFNAPSVDRVQLLFTFNQIRNVGQDQALWLGAWQVIDGNKAANPFGL